MLNLTLYVNIKWTKDLLAFFVLLFFFYIIDIYINFKQVKSVLMLDLFQLLYSPDVNWWTGVVWIIVMFLSAIWTVILTAPIHTWVWIPGESKQYSNNKLVLMIDLLFVTSNISRENSLKRSVRDASRSIFTLRSPEIHQIENPSSCHGV